MFAVSSILVPIDFADCSRKALQLALEIAEQNHARVELVHAWLTPAYVAPGVAVSMGGRFEPLEDLARREAEKQLAEFIASVKNERAIPIASEIAFGQPHEVVLERAKMHDLIVMGTHGRRGLAHLALGSVTEKVIRASPRPVLVVSAAVEERD